MSAFEALKQKVQAEQSGQVIAENTAQNQPQGGDGFLKSLIKEPIKTLLVKPAVRTAQALTAIPTYAFGSEEYKRKMDIALAKDQEIDVPILGKTRSIRYKTGGR